MAQSSINRIDAGEKSNFSTDAQYRWKLGSPSAPARDGDCGCIREGGMRSPPSHFFSKDT